MQIIFQFSDFLAVIGFGILLVEYVEFGIIKVGTAETIRAVFEVVTPFTVGTAGTVLKTNTVVAIEGIDNLVTQFGFSGI